LFFQAQDFQRALDEYEHVLRKQPSQLQAAVGAGKAAFQLHRYRQAEKYFSRAAANDEAKPLLEVVRVILDSDPDDPAISASERVRRIKKAFQHAGSRLDECREDSAVVADLRQRWGAVKSKVLRTTHFNDDLNAAMGLVFEIEQQTQRCAPAAPTDQALLLLANDRAYSHP
jgi:tetratricopeptide (TPR) repeat protein